MSTNLANRSRTCDSHLRLHTYGTDGENGLTKSLTHLPEITPSSVTRTRTYGISLDG